MDDSWAISNQALKKDFFVALKQWDLWDLVAFISDIWPVD